MLKVVIGASIVGMALIVGAAFGRFEHSGADGVVYRLDRLTGRVEVCITVQASRIMDTGYVPPVWCEAARQRMRTRRG